MNTDSYGRKRSLGSVGGAREDERYEYGDGDASRSEMVGESGNDTTIIPCASGGRVVSAMAAPVMTTTTTIPTKLHDGPANQNVSNSRPRKQRRTTKTGSSSSSRTSSRASTPCDRTDWPQPFKLLAQTHRALNLVYTFCCTRKHFATTFQNIKAAVEAQTGGRKLSVEDVARVKVLVPRAVRFETVDESVLDVMSVREAKESTRGKVWSDWDLDGIGGESLGNDNGDGNGEGEKHNEVLLFEFVDGDLKKENRKMKKKTTRKNKDEDLKMPVYSQKQMLALIDKQRRIRGYYDGTDSLEVNKLIRDIDILRRE